MRPVWKCKLCAFGPCYIQSTGMDRTPATTFGDDDNAIPRRCPHFDGVFPEFEVCAPEANPWSIRWIDRMQEWIMGEGYDNAPEEIRDGLAIDLRGRLESFEAAHVIGLLRDYEEDRFAGCFEREELTKKINKLTKWELLNAIFPEAFKAGIIYAEKLRQERENAR